MTNPSAAPRNPPFDLVIAGGVVVDPGQGTHERLDVGVTGSRIAAVGRDLARGRETQVLDAGGRYVTPGLIDLHAHLFDGISQLGVDADTTCLPAGVTTAVDAGTAGEISFDRFVEGWLRPAKTRTYAFVNLGSIGIMIDDGLELGESSLLRYVDVDRLVEVITRHPDRCVGIKIRVAVNQMRQGLGPLRTALEVTERTGTRLMVHITTPGVPLDDVFDLLRPGDIVTHIFHGRGQSVVDAQGRVLASLRRARERGVRTDIGHGGGSFAFAVARAALADGFPPDTLSTDLHTISIKGPMRDLPTTMAKFVALGMTLDEVVAAATCNAARSLGRPEVTGTLAVGDPADIAVLEDVPGPVVLQDTQGEQITAAGSLRAWTTVLGGEVVWRHGSST